MVPSVSDPASVCCAEKILSVAPLLVLTSVPKILILGLLLYSIFYIKMSGRIKIHYLFLEFYLIETVKPQKMVASLQTFTDIAQPSNLKLHK